MARKLPQLQRVLDAPALASVAYGEIASSIYFALGIIALHALGLTPVVLGVVGLLFLIVALSYAEGTASIRETGGAATFVRVAFNDLAGFITGWVLFLDYLIVIALSALFVPHYLGLALGIDVDRAASGRRDRGVRRHRRASAASRLAPADEALHLRHRGARARPRHAAAARDPRASRSSSPAARSRAASRSARHPIVARHRVRAAARDARVHRPRDRRELRRGGRGARDATCRAASSARSRLVVVIYVLIALRRALGVSGRRRDDRARHRLAARADDGDRLPRSSCTCRTGSARCCASTSASPVRSCCSSAMTTSISGFGRLAYSLGEHGQLPRVFGRLHRRTLVSPASVVAACAIAIAAPRRHRRSHAPGHVPREPLQLRRPARVHRGAARRDPAAP